VNEKADGGDPVVVVEKRLAHAHEDEIDALLPDLNRMAIEDRDHLPCDLSSGEIALQAEFRGQAELAVDGAADLARHADGCAGWMRLAGDGALFIACIGAVSRFALVTFGHPDGFDGLPSRRRPR